MATHDQNYSPEGLGKGDHAAKHPNTCKRAPRLPGRLRSLSKLVQKMGVPQASKTITDPLDV